MAAQVDASAALSIRGVAKSFGDNVVLRGVSFDVRRGEVHALLGANGAGKSTLMKILIGAEHASAGTAAAAGRAYVPGIASAADARAFGVVMVPQERTLCPQLSIVENLVLGVEPTRRGLLDRAAARALAEEALAAVLGDRKIALDVRAADLSVADQQLVEIARALVHAKSAPGGKPAVLVLDEPTSSLGKDDSARMFARVRSLAESGVAIVLVTHFLSDVREHADRYTVMRDGRVAGNGNAKTTPAEQIVREMLGAESAALHEAASARDASKDATHESDAEILLRVNDLAGAERPSRASFVLRRGRILGIAGLTGSGRTELLRAILGLDRRRSGTVSLTASRGIGLLSEDRGGEGLMLVRSIADNVALSPHGPVFVSPRALVADAAAWIEKLGIRTRGPDANAGELSGGNQQKVQIARMLREDFDVLLVDEPTRGIDVASKANILRIFTELAAKGKGIVLVSSQLDELLATCHEIAVLRRGELGPARAAASFTEESLLLEVSS